MATQWQTFPIEFKGGLISNLTQLQQGTGAVGSATILQNFEVNREGGYSKLKGFEKFSNTTVPGSGPVLGLKAISPSKVFAARRNASNFTQWYYSTGTTWTSMATSVATNGDKVRHTTVNLDGNEKTIFVDSGNYPGVMNNSANTVTYMTASNSSDIVGATHVAFFANAAFYSKGNTLYFTAPLTIDDFSAANGAGVINVAQEITGLAVFREQLIIFTASTVKRLTGSSAADFDVSSITDRIGCINGDTIQEVGGDIMYLSPDGIRLLSATDRIGDFGLDIASDPISKDATKFLASTSNYCSILFKEKAQYRVFAYIESEQKQAAKGLIATKFVAQGASGISWSTTAGIKAHIADSIYSGRQEVSVFANEDGYVYDLDIGSSFDGDPIEAIYESPYMSISDPQIRKTFYKLTIYAEPSGNMDLSLNTKFDFGSATNRSVIQPPTQQVSSTGEFVSIFGASNAVFGERDPSDPTIVNTSWADYDAQKTYGSFGGELDSKYNLNLVGSGKTIAMRIADNSTNPTFTLDAVLLEYAQNDRQ